MQMMDLSQTLYLVKLMKFCNTVTLSLLKISVVSYCISFIHSFPLNIQPEGSGASNELMVHQGSMLTVFTVQERKKMFYTPVLFGTFDVCTYHSQ